MRIMDEREGVYLKVGYDILIRFLVLAKTTGGGGLKRDPTPSHAWVEYVFFSLFLH